MKIRTDLFTLNGSDNLIVVDYTSHFPEIVKLRGTTSKHVIGALKSIMARFGTPKIVSKNKEDPHLALIAYRATPLECHVANRQQSYSSVVSC